MEETTGFNRNCRVVCNVTNYYKNYGNKTKLTSFQFHAGDLNYRAGAIHNVKSLSAVTVRLAA